MSGYANSVFRAHRYGHDHPALEGKLDFVQNIDK